MAIGYADGAKRLAFDLFTLDDEVIEAAAR
jgi:hypothetical protein